MVAEMRGDGEGLPQEANRDLILALRNNLPGIFAALEAAQQVQVLKEWQNGLLDTAAKHPSTSCPNCHIQLPDTLVTAFQAQTEKLTKALDWIRGYIDSHSHKHFVEFTNDNPELKAWRAEADRLLAKEALSAIEEEIVSDDISYYEFMKLLNKLRNDYDWCGKRITALESALKERDAEIERLKTLLRIVEAALVAERER